MNTKTLDILREAVEGRKRVKFWYSGGWRTVEPFLVGDHKSTGNTLLSAWHFDGFTESHKEPAWRLYTVSRINSLEVTDEEFHSDREGFNRSDSRMRLIRFSVDPEHHSTGGDNPRP